MSAQRVISDIAAPWIVNVFFFVTLGIALDAIPAGLASATLTGVLPRLLIFSLMRRGNVSHRHVTNRQERAPVFAGIVGCLIALIVILRQVETPRTIWVAVWAALGFIGVFAAVTLLFRLKISVHVGLWFTVWACLGVVLSPWWQLGLLALPVIAWSRISLGQHSPREVLGGLVAGVVVFSAAFVAL
ncbi:phosphoesterase [Corynebacterium sanguinis]|uniref:Phosphoesterase n=1 Tax=Corynebacterium sanguinis TaxID=2594913 RepID=A0A6C1TX51_9CORY|nr:phosphoesterase [Corynebacterium sanguinis]TVS26963.1 phosphoesterase [Corynebacterium sanguinis]